MDMQWGRCKSQSLGACGREDGWGVWKDLLEDVGLSRVVKEAQGFSRQVLGAEETAVSKGQGAGFGV